MTGDSVTGIGIDGSATARLNIFPGSRNMTSISSADEGRGYGHVHVHMAPLLEDDRKVIQGHSSGELFGCLLEPPQDLGRSNFVPSSFAQRQEVTRSIGHGRVSLIQDRTGAFTDLDVICRALRSD
ncbi:hypothetical protein GX48_07559 [Paracoccidioides brasiliensis]|nr:hypothetical protein GX48_07559 [Paracoccidioides brasiliensis]